LCGRAEYRQGSAVFLEKIRSLEAVYGCMRRARGDGNCFFRSFMFAYMEALVRSGDLAERNRCPSWFLPVSTIKSSCHEGKSAS
jgi:hypothetical protein